MRGICYRCKYADFKSNGNTPMAGFAFRSVRKTRAEYFPPRWECDIAKFEAAEADTMNRRRRFFESLGRAITDGEC